MEDEIQLEFRRFSADKQEQVRQLVGYCTLMGLTGLDLVSIGGKLARMEKAAEAKKNLEIGLSYQTVTVGADKKVKAKNEGRSWYYTDAFGQKWRFDLEYGYYSVRVTNCTSGKRKTFYIDNLVQKTKSLNYRANVMANLHYGAIQLNF